MTLLEKLKSATELRSTEISVYPKAGERSKYGDGDQKGAVNLLKPEHATTAAKLVKSGKSYSLAVDLDTNSPAYGIRKYECHIQMPLNFGGAYLGENEMSAVDEFVMFWPGAGTHIDGFGHVSKSNVFYDGRTIDEVIDVSGVKRFSTHDIPPIVSRGILIDMPKLLGIDMMQGGEAISIDHIEGSLKGSGLTLAEGDVVLFRTGWLKLRSEDPDRYLASTPGLGLEAAEYLAKAGVVMVGCDQGTTEVIPSENPNDFAPVHQLNLGIHGIHQLQHIDLEALSVDNVTEFMFVLGVPRLVGTSQMAVNPIAIA